MCAWRDEDEVVVNGTGDLGDSLFGGVFGLRGRFGEYGNGEVSGVAGQPDVADVIGDAAERARLCAISVPCGRADALPHIKTGFNVCLAGRGRSNRKSSGRSRR